MINNCDNTLPRGTALILLENTLIRGVLSVSFSEYLLKIKSFAMYRCLVELSVRYDGQSQSESEHVSLIDEHDCLILWQTGSICVLNTGFAPGPVVRLINTLVQFCSETLPD